MFYLPLSMQQRHRCSLKPIFPMVCSLGSTTAFTLRQAAKRPRRTTNIYFPYPPSLNTRRQLMCSQRIFTDRPPHSSKAQARTYLQHVGWIRSFTIHQPSCGMIKKGEKKANLQKQSNDFILWVVLWDSQGMIRKGSHFKNNLFTDPPQCKFNLFLVLENTLHPPAKQQQMEEWYFQTSKVLLQAKKRCESNEFRLVPQVSSAIPSKTINSGRSKCRPKNRCRSYQAED